MNLKGRNLLIAITSIVVIALDQISKVLIRNSVSASERIQLIGDKLIMMNVENEGAFLGMGSELNETLRIILLLILPILVLLFVLRYILKDKNLDNWSLFAFSAIIGGGIANIFDRIVRGSVTDFLFIDLGGIFKTGIFNVADMAVTMGMIILVIVSLNGKKKKQATPN